MAKVAFLGLGVMGYPMAGHLAQKGHEVTVFNRTEAKSDDWLKQYDGRKEKTPADAAFGQDFVMSCVGNDDDLEMITTGPNGAFGTMAEGAIFVDHTTASANIARKLAQDAKKRGISFIDAPVSGGQAGAENAALTVMCGGEAEIYARAEPVIMSYAKASRLMGGQGAGQLTKMVNQICIAGLLQGLSEGLAFAQKAGLDAKSVVEVISKGAAGSWQMDNRGNTMIDDQFDFGFAVDWMRKDLGICFDEAARNGAMLPVAERVDEYYRELQEMGGGRWDTSALIRRLV